MKHRKPKPCPFCGSKKTRVGYSYSYYVICNRCTAEGPMIGVHVKNPEVKAITAWNKRYEEQK